MDARCSDWLTICTLLTASDEVVGKNMCSVLFVAVRRRNLCGDVNGTLYELDSSSDHFKQQLAAAISHLKVRLRTSKKSTFKAIVDPWIKWRGRKVSPVFDKSYR